MVAADGYLYSRNWSVPTNYTQHCPSSVDPTSFRILLVFTFTNIFGFFSWTEFGPSILGVQYTLIDFLSRENSSVNSCKKRVKKW